MQPPLAHDLALPGEAALGACPAQRTLSLLLPASDWTLPAWSVA